MRVHVSMTNMLALPLAIAYSDAMPGDDGGGSEFAIIVGPIYISFSWGR